MAFLRGNGHVIDLSNRSLTEISEHYFSIVRVSFVALNVPCIDQHLVVVLQHVTKLDILDVSRNRLSSLPSSIGLARLIRKLKANQNMLSSLPPEVCVFEQTKSFSFSSLFCTFGATSACD